MSEVRRKFDKQFKKDAVELLRNSDKSCSQIAKDLGIGETALRRWNNQYDDSNSFPGNGNPRDQEMYLLKKENTLLKEERDILKKAMAIFSREK